MKIDENTKIDLVIKHDKRAIDVIASINKNFKKLKNAVLRKLLAPRVSIKDAARIGRITPDVILNQLQDIGFDTVSKSIGDIKNKETNINKLDIMRNKTTISLDVRPILEGGVDPFNTIMDALKTIDNEKECLKVINSFEPIPLLNILKKKSYVYKTERSEDGVVHVYISKGVEDIEQKEIYGTEAVKFEDIELRFKNKMTTIDVRDLEMPMPMVTILEHIEQLEPNTALYVHHKKLPQYLLPELQDRSYTFVSKTIDEDNIKLIIYKS